MRGRRFLILIITFSLLAPASAGAGYTHYWTWNQEPSRLALKSLITECLRVAEARADILEIEKRSPDMIVFNGIGDDAHEPFRFPKMGVEVPTHPGFNFCKTVGKPYDQVVTACLLIARDHFPAGVLAIRSDGDWDAWSEGRALYRRVLGREPQNPFTETFAPPVARVQEIGRVQGIGLDYRSGLAAILGMAIIAYFFFRGGAGWGSYYLVWLVGPTVIAIVSAHPIVLVIVAVGLVARRWLPDPVLVLKYAARIRSLDASVRANLDNVTARRDLAVIWLAKRRPSEAQPLVEQALARDPESTELGYLLGLCHLALKQWQQAVEAFISVLEREPRFRYGDAYLRAADALLALERWEDAEDALEQFIKINSSSLEARVKLAASLRGQGDAEGAKRALEDVRTTYRELPGFHRRRQHGWYLRALLYRALA